MYRQIAKQVEEKIKNGELEAEEVLPNERAFAADLNVTRNVIRCAYKLLQENGLVYVSNKYGRNKRIVNEQKGAVSAEDLPVG